MVGLSLVYVKFLLGPSWVSGGAVEGLLKSTFWDHFSGYALKDYSGLLSGGCAVLQDTHRDTLVDVLWKGCSRLL